MNIRNLAEAIILQSVEDLWDERRREDCRKFFAGEDYRLCASMADMNLSDQVKLLNMVKGLIQKLSKPIKTQKVKGMVNQYISRQVEQRKDRSVMSLSL